MTKIPLDKYYTPKDLAKKLINKTFEIIDKNNITEIIEPSAGNGSFSKQIDNCIAYDLESEDDSIIKQDFLTLDLEYKKGRLFIGNPPFGDKNILSVKFLKKCAKFGDYIAFILPISQLNNQRQFKDFKLMYSEDLESIKYSGIVVKTCFNIYKRVDYKINLNNKIKGITIKENRLYSKNIKGEDLRLCGWGAAIGKKIMPNSYAKELCLFINREDKDLIISLLLKADWCNDYKMTATPNLLHWQIYDYLRRNGIND